MSEIQTIETEHAPAAIGPYSQAVAAGGFLWCSGQIALDPASGELVTGGVEAQARRVLENLVAVLDAAGCTPADLLRTTIYLTDLADFPRVNEIYAAALGEARPARATVGVAALPKGASIEIDAIAHLR